MRIACLHTAESNVAVFARVAAQRGLTLTHQVRADLLAAAMQAGGVTAELAARTGNALLDLTSDADAVLLTCSTLGAAAEDIAGKAAVPVLRVDAALARQAVRNGGKVAVLCAAETTLGPTGALFEKAAQQTGAVIDLRLVPGAWAAFLAGETQQYLAMIAAAADQAFSEGIDVVALAQASMADAAALCRKGMPLNSPSAGLDAIAAVLARSL
ncbi:aspartate/glutamate racemase family protein [Ferrovibrio sp.]|uniref:aspartate/glutamate racemase family protein n=1 Tax=Ferrovibrio sp. TaxID=1917215 RepID=UPI000CAEABAF|nr:aspartate/glutamate racemase family protein [Ferrovibrio sp.]PJI42039.1 MAG: Asp/Glu racemase [Ferrovibrio sp.]